MKRPICASKKTKKQPRRVAVLVDTSSSWGRQIVTGIHEYIHKHERWQMFIETRGLQEVWSVPGGWRGDGIIARISNPTLAADLKARNIPVVNVSGIQMPGIYFPRGPISFNACSANPASP